MKKIILFIASLLSLTQARADEGMWTIYNLPPQVYEIMQNEGFTMSYNDLYYGENALKNAVVNFSLVLISNTISRKLGETSLW